MCGGPLLEKGSDHRLPEEAACARKTEPGRLTLGVAATRRVKGAAKGSRIWAEKGPPARGSILKAPISQSGTP